MRRYRGQSVALLTLCLVAVAVATAQEPNTAQPGSPTAQSPLGAAQDLKSHVITALIVIVAIVLLAVGAILARHVVTGESVSDMQRTGSGVDDGQSPADKNRPPDHHH